MDDRAVSEVLGFMLVFSLIALTVGIVTLGGFSELEQRRDFEQTGNAERAFELLADNVEDLYLRDAPHRTTEIDLAGAQLSPGEPATVSVTITNVDFPLNNSTWDPPYETTIEPITYSAEDGTQIVYEDGAVIRVDPNSAAAMKREPNLLFNRTDGDSVAVLPVIETRWTNETSIGGSATVLIRADRVRDEVLAVYDDPDGNNATGDVDSDGIPEYNVTYTMKTTPERAIVWCKSTSELLGPTYIPGNGTETQKPENICESDQPHPADTQYLCTKSGGTVTCTFAVDELYVTRTTVDVELNQ